MKGNPRLNSVGPWKMMLRYLSQIKMRYLIKVENENSFIFLDKIEAAVASGLP